MGPCGYCHQPPLMGDDRAKNKKKVILASSTNHLPPHGLIQQRLQVTY